MSDEGREVLVRGEIWRAEFNRNSALRRKVDALLQDIHEEQRATGLDKYGPDFKGDPLLHAIGEIVGLELYLATQAVLQGERPAPAPATGDPQEWILWLWKVARRAQAKWGTDAPNHIDPELAFVLEEIAAALASPAGVTVTGDAEKRRKNSLCRPLSHGWADGASLCDCGQRVVADDGTSTEAPRPAPVEGAGAHADEVREAAKRVRDWFWGKEVPQEVIADYAVVAKKALGLESGKSWEDVVFENADRSDSAPEPAPTVTPAAVREAIRNFELEVYWDNGDTDDHAFWWRTIRAAAEAWAEAQAGTEGSNTNAQS